MKMKFVLRDFAETSYSNLKEREREREKGVISKFQKLLL